MENLVRVVANTSNAQTWQSIDVVPGSGQKGNPARLKAMPGTKYQLQDLSNKNQGPKNLRTQRVGKNLHVMLGESVAPDLIVEGYFDEVILNDASQGLYGMSPEGQWLPYVTDATTLADVTQSVTMNAAAPTQSALARSVVTDFAVTSAATPLAVKTAVVLFGGVVGTKGAVQGADNSGAKAAKALAGIAEFAQTNTQGLAQAQGVVPDAATYLAAGVTGVDASNIGFINDSLATAAVDGAAANTQPKLQAIANACRAILAAAQGPAGATASVSAADFRLVGVTGVDSATKVALLSNLLSGSGAAAANSVAKLQVLSDAVAAVMAAAAGGLAPTLAQLQALGMDVTADNLAAVQAAIAATADDGSGVSTRAGLNAVIAAGQAALNKIEAYNNGNGTTPAALTLQDYADAGVTGVTPDNLVAVNAKVLAAVTGGANSGAEIQALVQAADAAIAKIEAFNNGNGTTPAALTLQDYADAGVSGVSGDNLAAVNAKVLAAATGGANSVAEIQAFVSAGNAALKKIEAYNNGNGTIPLPLTASDYAAVGISGVDEANITAVNARVLAAATGGADTVPEIQALVAGIQAAVDKIEAYNNGNGTTPSALTLQDYVDAGVTGVTADNLVAVNAKVLAAATGGANSSLEIQALVQAADAAIAKIEAFNNGDGTTPAPLSVADYAAAGITGVTADNVAAMNATVLAKNLGEADTPAKVQALLAAADAALNKIEAYNNGNGSTPAALTMQDYANAGVSGVSTDNLAAVNAKVLSAATGGANSGTEIQALVNAGNDALNKIEAYNNGDGTTPVALTLQDYADAGITGVSNDNLAALNATVLVQVAGGANTVARVQSLVGIANAALSKIEAYNNGNGTTPAPLSLQDYALAGVSGVSADNLVAVNAKVLAAATGGANSAAEIQAMVQAANSALAKIEAYNNGDGTTPAPLSVADYQAAGITGVNPSNLAALNAQVLAQSAGGAHTAPQVQNLVSVARAALAKIEAYNNGDGLEPPALAVQDYAAVGVTGVSADNLAAVNAQVLAASLGGAQDVRDIQTLVTAGNAALAKIEAFNNGNGSTPPALALSDYQAAGITGVSADNLAAVNAKVLAAATGGANTVAKVQTLVTAGNLALNKIEAYNNGDGTTPAALTAQDYADAGVTGVSDDNVAAVNAQVLRASMGGANTVSEVQSLVAQANAALATIEAFNNGNGSTPPSLALSDYQAAGITGVSADNLAAVNAKVLAAATGGANTVAKVQTLVTAGNLALNKIEAFNNGDGTTPAALTAQDYADAGLADVTPDNVVAVNANVLAAARGGAATVAQVQALVAVAVEAIAKVERYNNGDGSSPSALSVADYVGAGVRGVSADNLAAVNARVLASGVGGANTPAQIQAFADAVNTALDKVEAYNNGDGTTPAALTAQDYANAGMATVTVHNVAAVNAQVLAQAVGGAHTVSAISALVTAANNAIAKVEAFNNGNGTTPAPLSVQDYVNAGVSGVNDGNLSSVNARVLAAAVGGADTSPKIQDVVNAVNAALDKIEAYNQGNGSVPAALVLQDYVDAGIGGVSADNLAAVNAQVLAQNIGGAHNSLQLNTLVDAANAALAKIEAYNNGNGTTPAALTVADFEAAGITGVSDNNVASVNAKVLAAIPGATNSVNEVQNLVNALNLGLVKIEAYNRGDGTTPSALTTQDYADAGIAGVSSDNLAAVNAQVLRQNDGGADTVFKVQNLVTLADAALAKIEAYNNGNGTTPAALSVADYEAAGVTGVSVQNLASVNAKVLAAGMGGANSVDKIQAFANGVNYALVKIEAYNNGDGVTPSALSIQDYEAAGVSGVSANNLAAVNAQVLAVAATGADTPGEVQALVTAANSALAKIEAYNSDTPTPLALTLADYAAAGIGGVSVDNLAAVNAQVLAATQGAADSVGEIEYLVSLASDALAKIEAYNNGNGTTPTALTLQDYDAAGITGVTAANLAAVNAQVLAKSPLGADTVGEVQAIVLEANAAIDKIEAYNNGDGTTPVALVVADYAAAGVTGVNADNLAIINAKVLAAAAGASDTGPKIQSFADGVNNALVKIEAYNNGDGVTPVALTLQDFAAAGISGVNDANLAAVNAQVLAAAAGGANTVSKVQALVTGAGNALAKIEDYNNGNGTVPVALTVPDYEAAGVTGVNSDNVAAVNIQVLAQDIGGADSVLKVQALADAVNLSIAKIEAYNNGNGITPVALTVQDYAALGLTTVTVGNVAAVNAQVLAKPAGGANSVAEIQACITAGIAAVAKIEDYNNGNGTTPAALVAQDYADAGITGVNTDNLAAVNARVLAAATGAADTVAEIQAFANATLSAIAKIEAYNNGNGTTPVALTITDYEAAGVSNVSAGNLAAVNAQVLAQGVDGANAVAEIQACVAAGIAAIAKVEAYNNGNGTSPAALTVADYAAAGVTGVTPDNVAAVNAKVLAASTGATDTVAKIQSFATALNTALDKIEAYNSGDGTSPSALTAQDYAQAGIAGVDASNVAAVNAQVLAQAVGGAHTVAAISALVVAANNALAKIEAYNNGNGTTPAALAVADYQAAGITGVSTDNVAAVNARVLAANPGAADTVAEIQALASAVNTALAKIEAYNNGDGTTPAALSVADYAAVGITVTADNLAAVNAKVLSATIGGADSLSEVQALVTAAVNALANIEAYNNGNGTAPAALLVADYTAAGITGVNADNLAAVNAKVLAQISGGADTAPKVQALVNGINTALAKIEAYNNGDGVTPAALTAADYSAAGISGVSDANVAAVNAKVLAAAIGSADSVSDVQALVAAAAIALNKIEAYNNGNGTTPSALMAQDYADAGITGVTNNNVAAVNAQVLAASAGGADTSFEVQGLVSAANSALAKIEAYNDGDGTILAALSLADYQAAGISGVSADNLAAVNAQVLAAVSGAAHTVPEINALVVLADAALAKIEAYNNGNGTTPAALSVSDYEAAGITGVNADGVAVINAKVLNQTAGGANTVPKVQAIADGVNTALAKIEAYNNGNGTTPAALTAQDYADAGIANVTADNVVAVNAQVLDQATGGANSVSEVQALVAVAIAALNKIEAYNNGDGTTPAALALTDYQAAGITGVTNNNLAAVNAQVLAAAVGDANSVSEVQALVTAGNNALAKIEAYNNGNGTNPGALTAQDYAAAGITGVSAGNVVAVNAKVLAAATSGADTVGEVQALVNAANSALAKIEAYNNGNGTTPPALSVTDYDVIGVTGVTANNVAAVNAQVLAQNSGGANSVPAIQALVSTANAALAKIEAYNNGNGSSPSALTVADYAAAGITGVTLDNVAAVNVQVLAQSTGGADTVPDIQALIVGANTALAKIAAYSDGNGTTPAALTQSDYEAAGITGVSAANLLAVNAKVLGQLTGGADSVAQVQALVSAGNAALAKIEAYNNGNGSTPAALAVADYVAAGITGVNANNVAAVNAQVLAAASGGADNVPKVQTLVLAGNAALAKIEAYNNGDGTTPAALTEADYAAAGITDVIANNLVAVNAQVLARAAGGANTAPQVQTLVVAANAALAKIEAYNNGNGTTPAALVEADYQAVGVTGVTADNLAAVNAKVVAAPSGGADTVAEIQAIANGVTQAVAKIEAYNNGNGSSPSALSVADYEAAGITGVSADNLLAVNAQVLGAATGGADSVSDVQAWVTVATNAMAALAQAAQNNTAVSSQLAPANFAAVGVTGVSQGNVGALQSVLDSAAVVGTSVDSVAKIQAIVNAYQAIVLNADGTANNNATRPSQAQYALMGVTGVNSAVKESLLGDVVDSQSFANVDTVAKLQTLVAKVQNVMDVAALDNTHTFFVGNTPDGSGNTEITALRASLEALGLTGLNAQNMGAVWMSVRDSANAGTGVDTLSKLQTLINAANDQPTVLNVNVAISTLEDTPAVFKIADALASHISDADGTGVKGIAISWNQTSTAQGTWAYSSDNVTWTDLPVYLSQGNSITNALYLNATDFLRYTPLAHKNGAPGNLFFRAVDASFADTTSGTTGFDVSDYNKTGQSMTDGPLYFVLNVTAVNDAPVLADTVLTLTAVAEDAAAPVGAVGNLVSSLTNGVSDVDGVSVPKGIAITATNTSQGTLFYSTDAGATWASVGVVSTTSALLLANDANTRLYFQPSANFNGTVTDVLTFVAWDQTSGSAGTKVSTVLKGGATAFSTASDTVALTVTAVNDAPVIDTSANNFTIVEDNSTSFIIRDQLAGKISDIDGTDLKGIAIAQNTSTNGTWAWSTDGVSWTNFPSTYLGTLDWTQLLYLNATDRLRFTPNANANGTGLGALNFVAVDSSFANTSSGTQISGSGNQGGSGALSSQSGYFTVDVTAVNDAPTHTVPGAQTTNEDTAKVISSLQIADVDAGSSNVTVTLSVGHGTVTVLTGTGVTLGTNATASVTLSGSVTDINALLATASAVTYTPTPNYNGSDTLTMTTNDGGNAGSGGALSATSTVALTITAVNDAPVRVADTTFTLLEDTATSYTVSAMVAGTFTDVEGSAAKGVMIGWAPSNASTQGVWAYRSDGGTTWTDFPSDLNGVSPVWSTTLYLNASDSVRYTPASNATGNAGYLNLRVVDGAVAASITSGSRVNVNSYLATANSVYVTAQMTAINDTPTLSVTTSTPTFTEGGTSAQSLQGTAVSLFSGATSATGPSNESSQKLTSLQVTVSGLADGANEILTVNGTDVALTQGTSGTNANGTGYSVSVTGSTATITVTPTAGSASSVFNSIINGMSYTNTRIDNPTAGNRVVTLTGLSDDGGTANSGQNTATLSFASTVNVVGVNDAPTGSVTISGTAKQGQTLTASNSLADVDGMGTVSYSWFADGSAISGATASSYTLTGNEVGKLITAQASYTDGGNNATVVTSTASAAVASSGVAGDSVIALGSLGKLIAPVQVEGKWYYYWDRSGNGTTTGADFADHNELDGIFKYDINGIANTTVANADGAYGTTDVYRYATFNGVTVALPTTNGGMALPQGTSGSGNLQNGTAATTGGTSSFDELMAIWDTRNGTSTSTNINGLPAGWYSGGWYWSATASSSGHLMFYFSEGRVANFTDTGGAWVALQVISTPNTAPVLDAAQSPVLPNIATTATAPTNGNTTAGVLVSSLVAGVSDADSGATQGIAITAAASGTVYYSLNGGTTWLSIASTSLSATNALLLAADSNTRVYFQPTTLTAGTTSNALTFRAWDMTQHITEGVFASTVANGGKAQFSSTTDTVSLTVAVPVAMSSVALSDNSGIQNNTLNAGDVVTASVTYASAVTVSGAPTLSMVVGGTTVQATYDAANSTATVLKFNYTVLPTQADATGISIPANALSLNGGSITGNSNNVTAVVTNSLVSDNVSYLVDTSNPTATLTSTGTLGTTQSAVVQSSEVGTAYLVDSTATVTNEASILALADPLFNSVSIATAATASNLALTGLNAGTYKLYTADAAGNLSAVSGNSITVVKSIAAVNLVDISGGTGGFVINGAAASDYAGAAVSNAGDVNGDGWMDVIVGAYQAAPAGQSIGGRSYVVFGSAANSPINLLNLEGGSSTQGFAINGYTASAYSGASVSAAGDLNGDGLADLLVSMIGPSATTAGKAFVVYGKATGSAINLQSLTTAGNGLGYVINGQAVGDELGTSVSVAGDVNGDGLADLIVGAYTASSNSGKSYVVFGSTGTNPINAADLTTGTSSQGFVINGTANSLSGFSVSAAGDVNGDGLADVLVGARGATINTGKSYVVFGSASGQTINLADLEGGSNARGFVINGESQDDRNGISVSAAGDVNGDGLADVIVASRTALSNKGKSYVVFGKAGVSAVNLTEVASGNSTQGLVMVGESGGDSLGSQVSAAGDINGDGLADLLVGAFGADSAGGADAGKSYVVFGTSSGAVVNLANIGSGVGGFVINGVTANDRSGIAVSTAGDVNGDGFADLLVGADSAGGTGRAYVILGGTQFMPTANFVDLVGNASDNTLSGSAAAETFMAGDGNDTLVGGGGADVMNGGKGNDTFVLNASNVTAFSSSFGAGGNTTQLSRIDGGTGFDTLQITASGVNLDLTQISNVDAGAGDGTSRINSIERIDLGSDAVANTLTIAATDINDMAGFNLFNDGNGWAGLGSTVQRHQLVVDGAAGDSVVSSGAWVNAGTVTNSGKTYTVYNSATSATQLLVNSNVAVSGMQLVLPVVQLSAISGGTGGFVIHGESSGDESGYSVSRVGDVNGDGLEDILVGSWLADANGLSHAGKAYVVFGTTSTQPIQLSAVAAGVGGFVMNGHGEGTGAGSWADFVGVSVSGAGDLNGDGLSDLIVGAYRGKPAAGTDAGRSYVVFGKTDTAPINLTALGSGGFVINGQCAADYSGISVSSAGDVNGDGIADLIVGARESDPAGVSNAGRSYVVFGKANSTAVDLSAVASGTGGFVINGLSIGENSGVTVSSAGDVNGDGLSDLIIGAPFSTSASGGLNVGRTYVVFGKTSATAIDLSAVAQGSGGFVINGASKDDYSGYSVSSAGDVNGDGIADLLIGEPGGMNMAGRSYVVFGKANTGPVNLSDVSMGIGGFVISGESAGDQSGVSVSNAGDINGDGLSDLIVGAIFVSSNTGVSYAGRTYVVFGKADTTAVNLTAVASGVGGFSINGEGIAFADWSGYSVSNGGDINGDGFADLVMSAPQLGEPHPGRSYVIFGGTQFAASTSVVDFLGSAGADTQTGTSAAETFMAGDGADTLIGNGGADVMNGGKSNDTLVLNASNVAALAANFGSDGNTTQLARVDGGTGFDTLRLAQGAGNLDLTTIKNVDAMAGDGTSRIHSIERIDLGADSTANTLTIAARDVNDMAGFNLIRTGSVSADGITWTNVNGGTALSATTQFHQVVLDGGSNDVVNLKTGGTWVNAGTVNNGSSDYIVYQNASTRSQLIVKSGVTVNMNVAPVVLDVNRDGVLDYGQVTMDVNGDGVLDTSKWAGAQDGVLVWDKFADGLVHDNSQYAFSQYATTLAATDLQGLADAFDSNHDGVFNAADAKFAQFSVWRDINQNGVSDAGEVRSLADWGLSEINLTSDGLVRTPAAGVIEAGRTTATATDGTQVLVSDAGFEFSSLAYSATTVDGLGTHIDLLGSGMQLDLSRFIAQHGHVNEVDLTGTGANTIKLNLGDVLENTPLKLTGDVDDAVLLNAGDWVNTGDVRSDSGYAYAVYNANSTQTPPQLWLEQHMTVLMI